MVKLQDIRYMLTKNLKKSTLQDGPWLQRRQTRWDIKISLVSAEVQERLRSASSSAQLADATKETNAASHMAKTSYRPLISRATSVEGPEAVVEATEDDDYIY